MEQVRRILNDPAQGITSATRLWNVVKERKIDVTRAQVMELYKSANILNAQPSQKRQSRRVTAPFGTVGSLMADLMDVSAYATRNNNNNFVLHIIDLYSRYLWSFPLKQKTAGPIAKHLRSVLDEVRRNYPTVILSLSTDEGTEFQGAVTDVLKSFDVKHVASTAKNNQSPVERLNRTMWGYFRNYIRATGSSDFVRFLPQFVLNYNNRVHTATKRSPKQVYEEKLHPLRVVADISVNCDANGECTVTDLRKQTSQFGLGDIVRIANRPGRFDKRSMAFRWSENRYEIVEQVNNRFRVRREGSNEPLKTLFMPYDLLKLTSSSIEQQEEEEEEEVQIPVVEPELRAVKAVSRKRRLQRKEPAFSDREHIVTTTGEVITKGRLIAVGKRRPKKVVRYNI